MRDCCVPTEVSPARRRWLVGSAAALAVGMSGTLPLASASVPSNAIGADAALKRLMSGNARYAANQSQQKDFSAGRTARAQTQKPIAAILSCADSRVAPELAFDQGPGDLFVVRVAGNIVNNDGLASLEYAVKFLGTPLILVLGHTNCGAVDAAIKALQDNMTLPGHLPGLIDDIKPAVESAKLASDAPLLDGAIVENVRQNVRRLASATPILSEMVEQNKVKVVGAVYELATGKVSLV
jgi:carbonic anhydrase